MGHKAVGATGPQLSDQDSTNLLLGVVVTLCCVPRPPLLLIAWLAWCCQMPARVSLSQRQLFAGSIFTVVTIQIFGRAALPNGKGNDPPQVIDAHREPSTLVIIGSFYSPTCVIHWESGNLEKVCHLFPPAKCSLMPPPPACKLPCLRTHRLENRQGRPSAYPTLLGEVGFSFLGEIQLSKCSQNG